MARQRKSVEDWIQAAFRALKTGGPGAVRVEPLARSMDVSKGSFYWHFKDLSDLKTQMIDHWEARATADIIDAVGAVGGDAQARLGVLLELAMSDLDAPYGGPLTETAIRHWALQDRFVGAAQARVDAARLAFLTELVTETGKDDAAQWASLIYAVYIGSARQTGPERQALAAHLLALFMAQ